MKWDSPRYVEIKMDAEIGSYQPDPDVPEFIERPEVGDARTGYASTHQGVLASL